jgi:hypothetical protein
MTTYLLSEEYATQTIENMSLQVYIYNKAHCIISII